MDKGKNLGAGGGGDEVAEGEEIGPAGTAGVNDGGDAGGETEGIGLNAPGGSASKDVGMDINPAGGEDFASKVQGFFGGIGDGFGKGGNSGVLDGDIVDGVEVLGGINDGGVFSGGGRRALGVSFFLKNCVYPLRSLQILWASMGSSVWTVPCSSMPRTGSSS